MGLVALFTAALAASAAQPANRLEAVGVEVEQRGAACVDVDLSAELAALLATSAVKLDPRWKVNAWFDPGPLPESIAITLTVDDDEQAPTSRALHADNCCDAIAAAALIIAVEIDPALVPPSDPVPSAPAATPSSPVQRPSDSSAVSEQTREPRTRTTADTHRKLRAAVSASGAIDLAGLPGPSAILRLETALLGGHWRLGLGVVHRWAKRINRVGIPEGSAELSVWAASVRGCGVPRWRALEFPLCVVAEGGAVLGRGRGFSGAARDRAPWVAWLGAPGLLWRAHPQVGLWLEAQVGAALVSSRWTISNVSGALVTERLVARVGLGIDVRFPK